MPGRPGLAIGPFADSGLRGIPDGEIWFLVRHGQCALDHDRQIVHDALQGVGLGLELGRGMGGFVGVHDVLLRH
jgi:hypothetical protein